MTIVLHPGSVPISTLETIYWQGTAVRLDPSFRAGIETAARRIAEIAGGDEPVYGINTGFGKLASIRIDAGRCDELCNATSSCPIAAASAILCPRTSCA